MRSSALLLLTPIAAQLTHACLEDWEHVSGIVGLNTRNYHDSTVQRRQGNTGAPIGKGDRFEGGKTAPRGVGSQSSAAVNKLTAIFNVGEVNSALGAIVAEFGGSLVQAPFKTYENRTVLGVKLGDNLADEAYSVFLQAGIHSRERGAPDHLINFITDLLWAEKEGTGLAYGGVTYTAAEVKQVLGLGIIFFPMVNPDGVAFDQETHSCWRKNRNPASMVESRERSYGIDINRNADYLWDYEKHFKPGLPRIPASNDANTEEFHGTAPFSEPETQNIKWVMDKYPNIGWFLDLHSNFGSVFWPWGDDGNQVSNPAQNFLNSTYDGKRGELPDKETRYGSYIDPKDRDVLTAIGGTLAGRMFDAVEHDMKASQSSHVYPTCGSTQDYAYARHIVDPGKKKILSMTVEFGEKNTAASCSFYPSVEMYRRNTVEVGVALMEYLLGAVRYS